ncbi:hypothetical protein H310_05268 [Aphanomyces invadans]|uniref:ATP-binding Cassette (ABC) Superfamily n=1 Tax=Aphanomyces invadans TaxID=157072 RepID=A0A024UA69_9STRA|nr:hypothetical protein H310_05268 [Aphanomyces invadans]ETW02777.1 hypothetical protein H310_05268 [Aphanomyces invadans]RHY21376.1 hypothetical protein DYB32_009830 [Aphanomyces invadans]|eukprot:XP_008868161.1 hypothetical protein H310_05268 [Aphanomyces invadans]
MQSDSPATDFAVLKSPRGDGGSFPDLAEHPHPIDNANVLSKAIFGWASALIRQGNQRQLHPQDMWPLQAYNKARALASTYAIVYASCGKSLLRAFFSIYCVQLVVVAFMQLFTAACDLYGPAYVLKSVVKAVQQPVFDPTATSLMALSLYGIQVVSTFVKAHMKFMNDVIGVQFASSLRSMLFEKALKLNAKSKKEKSAGDIANLFSTDVINVMEFATNMNLIWIVPVQVAVVLYLLYVQVGWSIFVGLAAVFVILVVNAFVAILLGKEQEVLFKAKDDRMKVVHEVFGAIQIVKFNAWEEKFLDKLTELRLAELVSIWNFMRYYLVLIMFMFTTPVLVTITVFATYTLWMNEALTVEIVFTTLALFKSLQDALISLPVVVMATVQCFVSVTRINTVLLMDECDPSDVQTPATNAVLKAKYAADHTVIAFEHGSFGWHPAPATDTTTDATAKVGRAEAVDPNAKAATSPEPHSVLFADVNLTIQQGQFVVIHGAVGQGKSSLCAALLGEMRRLDGSVFVAGDVAYFAQQPWIQNATIRDNILFGKPFDAAKYASVVEACALTKDIAALPAGDRTEIGQKGINLSGGQKARVSLARACYSDAEIFVLDSPLSAVDAIVQNEIFTKCFLGLLRHKTIVLVTHSHDIIQSPHVHRTFVVQDGTVTESTRRTTTSPKPVPAPTCIAPLRPPTAYWAVDAHDSVDDLVLCGDDSDCRKPSAAAPLTSGTLVVDEERAEGRVSKAVVVEYIRAIGGWSSMVVMVVLTLAVEAIKVTSDMWLSHWSNQSTQLSPAAFRAETNHNITIYAILVVATCIATVVQILSVLLYGMRGAKKLFADMVQGLLAAPMAFFDTNPIGRILNRFGDDVMQVDLAIPFTFAPILVETAAAMTKIVTTIAITQWMGLVVVPLMAIYYVLGAYFLAPLREVNRIQKTTRSPLLSLVSEGIDGSTTIRAFGPKYVRRFNRVHDALLEAFVSARFVGIATNQWFGLRVELISCSIVFALLMGIVVMHDVVSPGLVALVITYGLTIPANLAGLVNIWARMETALIAPERLHEYIQLTKEGDRHTGLDKADPSWPAHGHVHFDHVSYRYKATDPLVLQDVSFSVAGGEKVGIVGRTGAGKSSLMMSLFRMNDVAAGHIRIDGVDIADVGLHNLRSHLAIIPQNPVLFKGTLRNYLDPFDEYDDDDLWQALKKVQLVDRVAADKLLGPVDENGENFSVGERQMLCMARALLRQAKIVILDEATAAIDRATDQLLQQVVRSEFASSTVLTIAHRLDTVLDCDRILVFDQGRLVQNDTPAALVGAGAGIFFDLVTEGGYVLAK